MADLPIPQVVNSLDVDEDKAYEPPYDIRWGVNRETTGTDTITMGRTIIPPRGRNALHFHQNCDTTIYVVKGPINIYWKEGEEIHEKRSARRPFRLFSVRLRSRPGESERRRAGGVDFHLWRDAQQGSGGHDLRG